MYVKQSTVETLPNLRAGITGVSIKVLRFSLAGEDFELAYFAEAVWGKLCNVPLLFCQ